MGDRINDKGYGVVFASSVLNPLEEVRDELDYTYTSTGKIVQSVEEERLKNGTKIADKGDENNLNIYY